MSNTIRNYDQRQALETSLQVKRDTRKKYLVAAERLEAQAVEYRNIAAEISRGIRRTQRAIKRLEEHQRGDNER